VLGDAHFGWLVPGTSFANNDLIDQCLQLGVVTPHFLAAALAVDGRVVVVDCGVVVGGGSAPSPVGLALAGIADPSLLVIRPCYLALRRALTASIDASGIVLVGEPQRALQQPDVEDVLGLQVRAAIPWRPAIATAVDAGLLARRLPSQLERGLRGVIETVAA